MTKSINHGIHVGEHSPNPYREPLHRHQELEVGLCLSGQGLFFFGEKEYEVHPGDIFVVNNIERHRAISDPVSPSNYYFLSFEASIFGETEQELLLPFVYQPAKFINRIPAELPVAQEIGSLIRKLHTEFYTREKAYPYRLRYLILDICILLLRHYEHDMSAMEWNRALRDYQAVAPIIAFMKERFREPLSLQDVTASFAISESTLLRLFHKAVGMGFKTYIMYLRINEAKELLASTDLTITEVYLQSGFQSGASFYRTFHDWVGMKPNDYRDQSTLTIRKSLE